MSAKYSNKRTYRDSNTEATTLLATKDHKKVAKKENIFTTIFNKLFGRK